MKRLTRRNRRVLLVLLTDAENLSGWPLIRAAQTPGPGVYRFLDRLQYVGHVDLELERRTDNRPRRCFYRLTPSGRAWAHDVLGLAPRGDAR